jgi:putative toxin-antitoxin system antitoxin component (TIGR02293 family)
MARTALKVLSGGTHETADVSRFVESVESGQAGPHAYALLLGLDTVDSAKLLKAVETGISYQSLTHLQRNLELSLPRLLDLVQIAPRTLARRKQEGRLRTDESDRVLRAARIFGGAIELFSGEVVAARHWLSTPQLVLGGAVPWDLSRTEVGSREVEAVLGRMAHGVYS